MSEGERQGRILIVDDEVLFAKALRRLLARDHDVTVENSSIAALERVRSGERYDAIICDMMMPELNGMALFEQIRAVAPDLAARMIFLTGGSNSVSQMFLDAIANPCFDKPCDLDALRAAVRRVIGQEL